MSPIPVGFTLEGVHLRGAGRARLRDVRLQIRAGERVALIGDSGAGKSSLLAVLGTADAPHDGRLLIDAGAGAVDPWRLRAGALRRLRACSHRSVQTPGAVPRQRVATSVACGLLPTLGAGAAVAMLLRTPQPQAVERWLELLGLGGRGEERLDRLSGGERQRVALAAALLSRTGALLLDEPLSALDPSRARSVLDLILDNATRQGRTLVCALHQHSLIDGRFDRVIRLVAGRVHPGADARGIPVAAGLCRAG